jgi:hypothetical protein
MEVIVMGLNFRKRIGSKHFKINVGKKGVTSTSIKFAKGVTYNTKRGLTIGLPGTGLSYTFGKKKKETYKDTYREMELIEARNRRKQESREFTQKFMQTSGGYNSKAIILIIFCIVLLFTPLMPLGLLLLIPSLLWFIIDTIVKIFKTNKAK